jgi:hypothetical protein
MSKRYPVKSLTERLLFIISKEKLGDGENNRGSARKIIQPAI